MCAVPAALHRGCGVRGWGPDGLEKGAQARGSEGAEGGFYVGLLDGSWSRASYPYPLAASQMPRVRRRSRMRTSFVLTLPDALRCYRLILRPPDGIAESGACMCPRGAREDSRHERPPAAVAPSVAPVTLT